MNYKFANKYCFVIVAVFATLFAIFPLTDTDVWWHLACAREWVTTWTPVREPVVNVHEYFQQTIAFVHNIGGAKLLVAFKAALWGIVFALFLWPCACNSRLIPKLAVACLLLFVFRYQFELRPVVFSLLFLGVYWNVLPRLFSGKSFNIPVAVALLFLQWFWCKSQGLYVLGPVFTLTVMGAKLYESRKQKSRICLKIIVLQLLFVLLLFAMPFMHREGLNLFLYPLGLLDRLLGLSPSASIFATEIAENRSPLTLLIVGENVVPSAMMLVLCAVGFFTGVVHFIRWFKVNNGVGAQSQYAIELSSVWLLITAILAFVAERNFVLFLPFFFAVLFTTSVFEQIFRRQTTGLYSSITNRYLPVVFIAFLLGLWGKSLLSYDSAIAFQRVPVMAVEWMKNNLHSGRLFNDDRAGGYLAFMNPLDSTFIDGRFILKTADFFERYLAYSKFPMQFLQDADSLNIDRVVLPLRYYARWDKLIAVLDAAKEWKVVYRDLYFVVIDRAEPPDGLH